jgi:phosphate acetyltransferase
MATFMETMVARAKADKKTIVLPEGNDERTLKAAEKILAEGIANLIIIGNEKEIAASGYDLGQAQIVDNTCDPLRPELAQALYEIRKKKGMTPEEADGLMDDVTYFGTMLLKTGRADGLVSGACHPTADVLHPALRVIKTAPDAHIVSSFFIMEVPDASYGDDGMLMFSDCAVCIQPTAEDLSEIALASGRSFQKITGHQPRVAMLSHSSYGSVSDDDTQKVVEATRLAKEKDPEMALDGELQADAALVPSVAATKAPDSPVAGKANVLVFPDLDAANIGYKLVQRLAGAAAYGPITQGLAMPMNDLSRGCSAEDIVGVVAITAVQAQMG